MEDFSWFCVNAQNHCAALWCSVSQSIWSNSVWKSQNTQTKAPLSTSKGFKRSIILLGLFQIIARKALRDLQILLYRQHERNVEFAEQTASFHIPRKIERTKPVCLLFKAQLFSHTSHFKRSDVPRKQRFHFSLPDIRPSNFSVLIKLETPPGLTFNFFIRVCLLRGSCSFLFQSSRKEWIALRNVGLYLHAQPDSRRFLCCIFNVVAWFAGAVQTPEAAFWNAENVLNMPHGWIYTQL